MNIVIVNCFDTWEHRVDLLYKVFTEEGHRVWVFTSDFRHIEKVKRTDEKKNYKFFVAEPYVRNLSIKRLKSHIRLSGEIFRFIDRHSSSIDLLWVLAPPNCFIADAGRVKQHNPKIRLVVDLMDLWPETMPVGKVKSLLVPWKRLRDKNIKYVDCVVTECNLYRAVMGNILDGKLVETLYLARENQGYKSKLRLPTDKISLCYLGSINNIIDIEIISRVIRECGKIRPVILHVVGDGERKNSLVTMAKNSGAKVVDHGRRYDRTEKQHIFDSCHFGLNIMKRTVCVGLTMKSIDYFEFGLPIINNIKGDTWNAVKEYGCGVNIDDMSVGTFRSKMEWYLNFERHRRQRLQSRCFFEEYLTEKAFRNKIYTLVEGTGD